MQKRISMVVQYFAFISLMVLPWAWLILKILAGQVSLWDLVAMSGWWLISGVAASLWHRNMVGK